MLAKQAGALGLAALALVGGTRSAAAQNIVTLSLDVYYGDSNGDNLVDALAGGSWQLVAHSRLNGDRGIAGLDTALVGVVNSEGPAGSTFRAPNGAPSHPSAGFLESFAGKPWTQDQDNNALTHDMLFGQVPVAAPGPQDLFYDVGQQKIPSIKASNDAANGQPAIPGLATVVTWNFDDPLGDYLGDTDQTDNDGEFQRGVILAQGRFNAGSTPAYAGTGSGANVFTALGTQTNPPAVGTIQSATVVTLTRNNLFTFSGDVDLDHDVDVFQAGGPGDGQIITINAGRTGNVLWQEGDLNGDKDCDIFQADGQGDAQILTEALGLGGPPPVRVVQALAAPGTATATYNFVTGELKVDIGAGVGVVGFESAGLFNTAVYAGMNLPAYYAQITPSVLGLFDSGNALPTGEQSLLEVLPAGLSASQIQFGYTPIGLASVVGSVAVVPEPGVMGLAFGALAVLVRVAVRRAA
jgi:hypothetical protein